MFSAEETVVAESQSFNDTIRRCKGHQAWQCHVERVRKFDDTEVIALAVVIHSLIRRGTLNRKCRLKKEYAPDPVALSEQVSDARQNATDVFIYKTDYHCRDFPWCSVFLWIRITLLARQMRRLRNPRSILGCNSTSNSADPVTGGKRRILWLLISRKDFISFCEIKKSKSAI